MNGKDLPFAPPKRGALYLVPNGIRPVMQRTAIEVSDSLAQNSLIVGVIFKTMFIQENYKVTVIFQKFQTEMENTNTSGIWK